MKKLITILTIMIVLVGSAFAVAGDTSNGTAIIDISAAITPGFPTFRIQADTITTGAVGPTAQLYADATSPAGTHGSVAITTDLLLTTDASIVFGFYQTATTRGASNYRLKVTGTQLKNDAWASIGTADQLDANEFFAVSHGDFATVALPNTAIGVTVTAVNSATGEFASKDGGFTVVNDTNAYLAAGITQELPPVKIGTVTYTWDDKASAAPGDYSATVTLEVEAY